MGCREQQRANLKQQEKATSVASIHRGSLLGDMACEDPRSGSIIVVISAPRWSPGSQAACLDLPASQSVYSQPRQQGKGRGLATRLDASVQLQQQHSCLFIWSVDTGGFSFSAVLRYSNVCSTCSTGEGRLNAQGGAGGSDIVCTFFDQLFWKTAAISQCASISVSIRNITQTSELSFKVRSRLKVCAPMWNHAWACCAAECRVHASSFRLIIPIQLQPFSKCLLPSHLPQPFGPPPVIKRPPPGATPIPWSPISRAGTFPCTDAEVEAWRSRKGRKALSGQREVEVPWRTQLPGWLSDEQGSVKGWGRSFPQTISPSVSQSVLQRWSTDCSQTASYKRILPFCTCCFLKNLYLNHPFSNECMCFFACTFVLHMCGSSFIFLQPSLT